MKAAELDGSQLDWAVAMCEGYTPLRHSELATVMVEKVNLRGVSQPWHISSLRFCESWGLGGPIIEREGIELHQHRDNLVSLYEYNPHRLEDFKRWGIPIDVVQRPLLCGPGRFLRKYNEPGKWHLKWFAARAFPRWGWKAADHFPSDTPLVAAMRCYVASKLGAEVEIPRRGEP
jgi:hypothetical protein